MKWSMVDEMNEIDCGLKGNQMKHERWNVDWKKWDKTWTIKCGLKEMWWNMNNEVYIVTDSSFTSTEKQKFDLKSRKCDQVWSIAFQQK